MAEIPSNILLAKQFAEELSDYPEFAAFLVERGIDSISLDADALVRTTRQVLAMEKSIVERRATAAPPAQHASHPQEKT
jgi:hypothetical protein